MYWLFILLLCACGRIDFGTIGDGGGVAIGGSCSADADCGSCARCEASICQTEPINALFLGHRSTCYLGANGSRWCVGENTVGQLGLGDEVSPHLVFSRLVGDDTWDTLYLGYGGSFGRRSGEIFSWGFGVQTPVADISAATVAEIQADGGNTCIARTDGTLDCDPTHTVWSQSNTGELDECAIKPDGTLWCWGESKSNDLGQVLADGTMIANPMQVGTDTDWLEVDAGADQTCARKTDHSLWCWGDALRTGTNGVDTAGVPTQIGTDTDWTFIKVHYERSCAGKPDGSVYCWGVDDSVDVLPGQLMVLVPTAFPGTFDDWRIGGHHECGHANGAWSCYGWNGVGQLGLGTIAPVSMLTPLCPS